MCGRPGCGEAIIPGEKYFFWEPRYGPKHVRCFRHFPKRSETTTSKMSEVYAAVEDAEEWAQQYDGEEVEDYESQIENVSSVVEEKIEEYREAAEQFGGVGENSDRADELEQFYSELTNVDFEALKEWITEETDADDWREDMASRLNEALGEAP